MHDYSTENPEWVEIRPGHFIYGSKSELTEYEKELVANGNTIQKVIFDSFIQAYLVLGMPLICFYNELIN